MLAFRGRDHHVVQDHDLRTATRQGCKGIDKSLQNPGGGQLWVQQVSKISKQQARWHASCLNDSGLVLGLPNLHRDLKKISSCEDAIPEDSLVSQNLGLGLKRPHPMRSPKHQRRQWSHLPKTKPERNGWWMPCVATTMQSWANHKHHRCTIHNKVQSDVYHNSWIWLLYTLAKVFQSLHKLQHQHRPLLCCWKPPSPEPKSYHGLRLKS